MRSKINWIAVRTAYVVKGWSAQKCAEEFGIDPTTIKKRASAEGWTQERHRNTTDAATAATIEATALVVTAAAELKTEHARLLARLHGLLQFAEEDIALSKGGRPRAETVHAYMRSYEIAAKLGRLGLGLTEGQSSVADAPDESIEEGKKYAVVVDVPKTA